MHEEAGQRDHQRRGGVVRAAVGMGGDVLGQDLAPLAHAGLDGQVHGVALAGHLKDLVPIVDELDGPVELAGEPARAEVLGEHVELLAEAAAHLGLDDPHLVLGHAHGGGQVALQEVGDLGGGPDGEVAVQGDRTGPGPRAVPWAHGSRPGSRRSPRRRTPRRRSPASTSPNSLWIATLMLFGCRSWMTGAPSLIASSGSKTAGSSSYSTRTRRAASSAVSWSTATTAGHFVADVAHLVFGESVLVLGLGHDAVHLVGDVGAGQNALHAGQGERRRGVDVQTIRPCEIGERTMRPESIPGRVRSSVNRAWPAHLGGGVVHGHTPPDDVHHLHDAPPAVIATVASTAARILT